MMIVRMRSRNKSDARARSARSFFDATGFLTVIDEDPGCWRIIAPSAPGQPQREYLFFPASGHWRRPDKNRSIGAGGARALIAEIQGEAAKPAG